MSKQVIINLPVADLPKSMTFFEALGFSHDPQSANDTGARIVVSDTISLIWKPNMKTTAFVMTMLLTMLLSGVVSGQQKPTTGYAPVNGLKMYYEIHGSGEPVVLLHGAFMAITDDWRVWIGELSKTRKVIAVEMQGHGRTADIVRDITSENLADDVSALLDYLKIPNADIIGYSMGGGVAMQCAIRHPEKVRKVVSISAPIRRDGWVKEGGDALSNLKAEDFKGSPIEAEYKKLSPTPDGFPSFFNHIKATALRPYDFGADKLKATKAPMFFIHGDVDGVRLDHIAEMYRLKGGDIHGDMRPHPESRLAILPDTTHVTLMNRMTTIVPMVNDFLDAKPQKQQQTERQKPNKNMTHLTTYLLLNGNCKPAMQFYKSVFGGELTMTAVGESPMKNAMPPAMHDKVLNARLISEGIDISASDWLRPAQKPMQGNMVCLYLSGGTFNELKTFFDKLSEGADITDPLKEEPFGTYGALNDKFGIRWMFHANKE